MCAWYVPEWLNFFEQNSHEYGCSFLWSLKWNLYVLVSKNDSSHFTLFSSTKLHLYGRSNVWDFLKIKSYQLLYISHLWILRAQILNRFSWPRSRSVATKSLCLDRKSLLDDSYKNCRHNQSYMIIESIKSLFHEVTENFECSQEFPITWPRSLFNYNN